MAKKGIFRRFAERVTAPIRKTATATTEAVKKTATAAKDVVTAPFVKKPKPRPKPKPKPAPPVSLVRTVPKPRRIVRPTPAVAREQLMTKLQDMYWLQKKWDAAAMSRRITKMTDAQVYAALDMSEDDIETAARAKPASTPQWAAPDDPTSNILWYHGGETMIS